MKKTLLISILFYLSGCKPPTIKKPIEMFAINLDFNEAAKGKKNLNFKNKKKKVGEWVTELEYINLSEAPRNLMCFSMETWLKQIKPKLKEGATYYRNSR
jgi:hypothetical protein